MFDLINSVVPFAPDAAVVGSFSTVGGILGFILNIALGLGIAMSAIFTGIAGIQITTAGTDFKAKQKAFNALKYSIIAFVLIMGALVTKTIVLNIIGATGDIQNPAPNF